MTYTEKLRDPRWQRKRLEIMNRDGFRCKECKVSDATLNIHHGYYERGLEPWEYEDETLHTLCERCHEIAEEARRHLYYTLSKMSAFQHFKIDVISQGWDIVHEDEILNLFYKIQRKIEGEPPSKDDTLYSLPVIEDESYFINHPDKKVSDFFIYLLLSPAAIRKGT